MISAVVNLDAVLHWPGSTDGLDVQPDDLGGFRTREVAAHLDVRAERHPSRVIEDFRMQPGGPAGIVFVQARAMNAGVAVHMMRFEARVKRPRIRVLAFFLVNER